MQVAFDAGNRQEPGLAAQLRLDRGGREEVRAIPMRVGGIITLILVDGVETHVQDERGRRGDGRTVGEVVDADLDATAGTGLGFGVSAERQEGEKSGTRGARGEKRRLHDIVFLSVFDAGVATCVGDGARRMGATWEQKECHARAD